MDHQTKPSKNSFYVYVLKSESDGTHYIGYTRDVEMRLKQHNHGKSTYTRRHIPYKVVYTEEFPTRFEALAREKALKGRANIKSFLKIRVPSK